MPTTLTRHVRSRIGLLASALVAGALLTAGPAAAAEAHEASEALDELFVQLLPEADRVALLDQDDDTLRLFDLLPAADGSTSRWSLDVNPYAVAVEREPEDLVHVVEPGENLADIAARYDLDGRNAWRRLFDANPELDDPNRIEVGDEIRIPGDDEELERRDLPAAAPAPTHRSARTDSPSDPGTDDSVWDRLAQCEANGNWAANTGNGYHGGLQFHPQTWNSHGGQEFATYAYQASREQQIVVAERVLASQGWGAWPACSRRLGLR